MQACAAAAFVALLAVTASGGPVLPEGAADEDLFQLNIVHLNDFHARFEQTGPDSGECPENDESTCVGGIARVVSEAKRLQQLSPENTLLLNAGDNFQGTLWYTMYRWNVTQEILNLLDWDAFTLGNHEFDRRLDDVVPFIKSLNAPVVVANIDDAKEPSIQGLYNKTITLEKDDRKIGIIGVIIATTKDVSSPGELEFIDEIEAVREQSDELREKGVDIIILLSHAGIDTDKKIAEEDPNVDIIVGGHSHTLLYTPKDETPSGDYAYDVYPIIVDQGNRKVAIVQAGAYTKYLGYLNAFFNADGELDHAEGNPIFLNQSIEMDEETVKALAPWKEGLVDMQRQRISSTAVLLEQNGGVCRTGECNLGSLVADAYVHAFAGKGDGDAWTMAAIGITNAGGLRAPIGKGNITFGALLTTLPFENTVDVIKMKGVHLRQALEQAVSTSSRRSQHPASMQDPSSRTSRASYVGFLQVSGLRVQYDESMPGGSRVRDVKVLCHECQVPIYKPLEDEEEYPVAINSFLAGGGDGYYVFVDHATPVLQPGPLDFEVVQEYLEGREPITQAREGRIIFQEDDNEYTTTDPTTTAETTTEGSASALSSLGKVAMTFVMGAMGAI